MRPDDTACIMPLAQPPKPLVYPFSAITEAFRVPLGW